MSADDLLNLRQRPRGDKTVVVCWPEGPKQWIKYLTDQRNQVSVTPTRSAHTLEALVTYYDFLKN